MHGSKRGSGSSSTFTHVYKVNHARAGAGMGNMEAKQAKTASVEPKTSVSFTLNGASVDVQGVSPSLTLNEWLRSQPGLTGTKKMCGEGGCGCCVVAASLQSPIMQEETTFAINSIKH